MLSHRLQILIEPEQYERLRREAKRRGEAIGAIVREAIDRSVPGDLAERREAWRRLESMEPFPVPDDPDELEAELDSMFADTA